MIIALLKNANAGQQTAIGTGLGQAAGLCIRSDPAVAGDIQTQLAGTTSDVAKNAYAAVTGNQPIRSVAGGGGVSGGSSGGSTGWKHFKCVRGIKFSDFQFQQHVKWFQQLLHWRNNGRNIGRRNN